MVILALFYFLTLILQNGYAILKIPEPRHDANGDDEADDVQRQSDLCEVEESIATDTIHVGIGLVADGCREAR